MAKRLELKSEPYLDLATAAVVNPFAQIGDTTDNSRFLELAIAVRRIAVPLLRKDGSLCERAPVGPAPFGGQMVIDLLRLTAD